MAAMTQAQIDAELQRKKNLGIAPTNAANQAIYDKLVAVTKPPTTPGAAIGGVIGAKLPPTTTAPMVGPILNNGPRPQVSIPTPVKADAPTTPSGDGRLQGPYPTPSGGMQQGINVVNGQYQYDEPVANTANSANTVNTQTNQTVSAPVQQTTQTPALDTAQKYIDQLNEARKQAAIAGLEKARDAAMSNLGAEKTAIKPKYYDAKNQVAAGGQQTARNFAEYMANRGGSSAGVNAQVSLSNGLNTQGGINNLGAQETAAYTDIAKRSTDVGNAFQSDKASAEAGIDADRVKSLLDDYYNAQARNDTLAQNAIMNEIQKAQLTGQYNSQPTLAAQNQTFSQNLATNQYNQDVNNTKFNQDLALTQQQQDVANTKFAQQMQLDDVAYRSARDNILDKRYASEFENNIKQLGFENAIKKAVTDNQITNDKAQLAISRQNAATSAAGQGNSVTNSEQARLMDIWQATGKAPAGIPGVAVGTPIYEKPSTTIPKVDKAPTAEDYDKNIKPVTNQMGQITNLPQIEDQIILSGLSDWEQYKLYNKYGIHWDDPIPPVPGK